MIRCAQCAHVCVHMYMCVCLHTMCPDAGQMSLSGVFPHSPPPYFLRQGLSLNLTRTRSGKLGAGKPVGPPPQG